MAAEGEVPKGKNYYQNKKKKGIKRAKEAAKEAAKQSRVDGATLEYWRRVEDTLAADEFEEEEDKALFITNVLSVLDGSELTLARDQAVSRIMEKLLQAANEFQVRVFMDRLSGRYLEMTKDRVASHVVQRVLAIVPRLIAGASGQVDMEQEDDNDGLRSAEGLFLAMVDELTPHMVDLARQEYSSHIVRAMLGVLCGGGIPDTLVRSRASRGFVEFAGTASKAAAVPALDQHDVPPAFIAKLRDLAQSYLDNSDLCSDVIHPTASPVVQTLLLALNRGAGEAAQTLAMRILANGKPNTAAIDVEFVRDTLISNQVGSHVIERLLDVAGPGTLSALYLACYRGNMVTLATDPIANYTVQRLLTALSDVVQQKMAVEELLDGTETILAANCPTVVVRMVEVAARIPTLHKAIMTALLRAFHITEPGHRMLVVPLMLRLSTYETFTGTSEEDGEKPVLPIVVPGALLVQALWTYPAQQQEMFASSLLALGTEGVVGLALHSQGSRVVEGFVRGLAEPSRKKKLIKMLGGAWGKLATDKYGSHVVEACYGAAEVKVKEAIGDELLASETQIKHDMYGRMVWSKCGLEHLRARRGIWREKLAANERKKDMFADILQDAHDVKASKSSKRDKKAKNNSGEMDDIFESLPNEKVSAPPATNKKKDERKSTSKRLARDDDIAQAIKEAGTKRRKTKTEDKTKGNKAAKKGKFMMS